MRNTQHGSKIGRVSLGAAIILALLLLPAGALAQAPVTAQVDRDIIAINEQVTLTVSVSGDIFNIPTPRLDSTTDFKVVGTSTSTQIQLINGELSSQGNFIFRLEPFKEGQLLIPAATVKMNGQTYSTEPIPVQVLPAGTLPSPNNNTPDNPPDNLADQFFVEAEVDNATPWLGQQIIYSFKLYQTVRLLRQPDYQAPAFTNFWGQNLLSQPQYHSTVNGQDFMVTEIRTALFPASVGEIIVEPATLIVPGGLFETDFVLETDPVTVNVQPLPPDAPPDFNGAVGRFTATAALNESTGRVNEPVTFRLTIEGAGNIETLAEPPFPDLPNWRIFDSQSTTEINVEGEQVQGRRQFERLLVPGRPGDYTIPPISFSYFDPQTDQYQTLTTEPLPITIDPGEDGALPSSPAVTGGEKQPVSLLADDIRHIKPVPTRLTDTGVRVLDNWFYWGCWLVPALAVAGLWLWNWRRVRLLQDTEYQRRVRARSRANKLLSQAGQPDSDAYGLTQRALLGYLADRLNHPTVGLTAAALTNLLREAGLNSALIEQVQTILNQIDAARFAPVDRAGFQVLLADTRRLIDVLEKELKP